MSLRAELAERSDLQGGDGKLPCQTNAFGPLLNLAHDFIEELDFIATIGGSQPGLGLQTFPR